MARASFSKWASVPRAFFSPVRTAKEPAALAGWVLLIRTNSRVSGRVERVAAVFLAIGCFCWAGLAGLAATVGVGVDAVIVAYVLGGVEAGEPDGGVRAWEGGLRGLGIRAAEAFFP